MVSTRLERPKHWGSLASTASDARLSLPPPARSCDRMLGLHAHAPHDTSRTSARGSCARHRRSPLRSRSTLTPAKPSDATGGDMRALADVYIRTHPDTHMHTHAHTFAHTVAYIHTYTHANTQRHKRTCAHSNAHTYTHTFLCMCDTHMHTHATHVLTHSCLHTHIHT